MSLRDLLESGANVSVTVTLDDLRAIFNEAAKAEEFLERLGIEIKDREQGRGMRTR